MEDISIHGRRKTSKGFKRLAITGFIVLAPFIVLFFVGKWFLNIFKLIPGDEIFHLTGIPLVNDVFKAGAITLLVSAFLIGIGKLGSTRKGAILEKKIDVIFMQLPIIGSVYNITKTATDTALRKTENFQHPIKISYNGIKLTAFQTGKRTEDGKRMVFVPTSPNITSGFVLEVDESVIEETGESLETAFTRVLSAGFSG